MNLSCSRPKVLGLFSLVMINVIAVDSLRALPISAEYGFSIVFFYLFGGLFFLLPVALIAAELATGWPRPGGIYVWVSEAFGKRWGFLTIWLQWLYNIFWYPTIMAFVAGTLAWLIDPQLAQVKLYMWSLAMLIFWAATAFNWFGMRLSAWISMASSLFGTLFPMFFIIILAISWCLSGRPVQVTFNWQHFWPNFTHLNSLSLTSMVLFSLIGLEMSAVHAGDVKNPQRDYPRALFISAILILSTLILGSLAIAMVIPQHDIQFATGLMDGFAVFFKAFHLDGLTPVIAILIVLGCLGAVTAWIIGPTSGVRVAATDGSAPAFFRTQNRHGAPVNVLWVQGILFSLLTALFIFMPSVNSAFVLLSAITAQLALLVYLLIFAAFVRLRYVQPHVVRKYRVPGGKGVAWALAGVGTLTCLLVFCLGFLPPDQIPVGNVRIYETLLVCGTVLACLPPFFMRVTNQNTAVTRAAESKFI